MNKQLRYSDEELKFIKDVFSGDEKLLRVIQRAMFFEDLSKDDVTALGTIAGNSFFLGLLQKEFNPKLNTTTSFLNNLDLWSAVNLGDKSLFDSVTALKVRKALIELVHAGMDNIQNPKPESTSKLSDFDIDTPIEDISEADYIKVKSRAEYIQHVETRLQVLSLIAGQKNETLEEQKKRLTQNSSK